MVVKNPKLDSNSALAKKRRAKTAGGGEAGRGSRQARMSDLVDSSTAEVK